jgi:hypothetical protein
MLTDADVKVREKLRKAAMDAAERAREEGEGEGAEGGGQVRARRRDAGVPLYFTSCERAPF